MKGKGQKRKWTNKNKVIEKINVRVTKNKDSSQEIKRGEVYWADLSPVVGSEQGGVRPSLVVSNDIGNRYSAVVNVVPLTSQVDKLKKGIPTHALIETANGLQVALGEQNRVIDKERIGEKIMEISELEMHKVNIALQVVFGLSQQ